MLNELDKELKSRGHRFLRYVYYIMIFCTSKKGAKRTQIFYHLSKEAIS